MAGNTFFVEDGFDLRVIIDLFCEAAGKIPDQPTHQNQHKEDQESFYMKHRFRGVWNV